MLKAVLVAVAILTVGAPFAVAEPDPVLQFQGTITAAANGVGTPVSVTVDCTSGECIFTGAIEGGYLITPIPLTYAGGT